MAEFKRYLIQRPEAVLAVVCHWGVLRGLTNRDFENCEVQSYTLRDDGFINPDW